MAFKFIVAFSALLAVASAGIIASSHPVTTYAAAAPVAVVAKIANPSVDAVGTTHQNVVRSFGGTVSTYSKAVDTPYSSVRKEDTRISNNVYAPAVAKTVTSYVAPSATVYEHHHTETVPAVAATYTHAAPVAHHAPLYHHDDSAVYHQAAPVYQQAAPVYKQAAVYQAAAPVYKQAAVYQQATPVYHQAAPAATSVYHQAAQVATPVYHHAAPVATPVYHQAAQVATPVYHQAAAPVATTTYNHGPSASTYSHNAPGVAAYGSNQVVHYSPADMVSHMRFEGFGTHWGF